MYQNRSSSQQGPGTTGTQEGPSDGKHLTHGLLLLTTESPGRQQRKSFHGSGSSSHSLADPYPPGGERGHQALALSHGKDLGALQSRSPLSNPEKAPMGGVPLAVGSTPDGWWPRWGPSLRPQREEGRAGRSAVRCAGNSRLASPPRTRTSRARDGGGRTGQGRVSANALSLLPARGPGTPSPEAQSRGGPSGPQLHGLPGSFRARRDSRHRVSRPRPRQPGESRARPADSAAATGRDRPFPRDPSRPPAQGRPPPTPRRGDGAGHRERPDRSVRVGAVPSSPRPGTKDTLTGDGRRRPLT